MTAVAMEKLLEVPKGSFSNWKRGMGKAYYEHIGEIADRLDVTIDYLIRGKEIKADALSSQEMDLIENFRSLTIEAKNVILKKRRIIGVSIKNERRMWVPNRKRRKTHTLR